MPYDRIKFAESLKGKPTEELSEICRKLYEDISMALPDSLKYKMSMFNIVSGVFHAEVGIKLYEKSIHRKV